jgi:hypothetical protein
MPKKRFVGMRTDHAVTMKTTATTTKNMDQIAEEDWIVNRKDEGERDMTEIPWTWTSDESLATRETTIVFIEEA